jgi:tRNA (adenine57-N1/adenine58-N1)-methyltransferase catalytic subunit
LKQVRFAPAAPTRSDAGADLALPLAAFAGTGSGSFSHSIARSVGKTGKVHSFEFHEERFSKAKCVDGFRPHPASEARAYPLPLRRIEFEDHGLDDIVTLKHQNVYKDGFELKDEVDSGGSGAGCGREWASADLAELLQSSSICLLRGRLSGTPRKLSEYVLMLFDSRATLTVIPLEQKDRQSRICCFSPCIEQVLRTVTALSELGFSGKLLFPSAFLSLS